MGERYGARKAEIGRPFQKERESAGVERSRISRGFGKQRKNHGTSGRVLGCLTVRASRNSIFIQQSRLMLPSPLPVPFLNALAHLCAVVSLLVLATLSLFVCLCVCVCVEEEKISSRACCKLTKGSVRKNAGGGQKLRLRVHNQKLITHTFLNVLTDKTGTRPDSK